MAAAVLSDRYLTGVIYRTKQSTSSEAGSSLIDFGPDQIDVVERRIRQIEIERLPSKETDAASNGLPISTSVADRQEELPVHRRWQAEKDAIGAQSINEELDQVRNEVDRETDLEKATQLRYGRIPELERLDEARRSSTRSRRRIPC